MAEGVLDRFRLDGHVAVVTGAGRGIGRGIAIGLAQAGSDVVLSARRTHEIEAVAEEVRAEVRQRIRDLAPGGGYAVGSSNSVAHYVPLENYNAMREATFEYGAYPIRV